AILQHERPAIPTPLRQSPRDCAWCRCGWHTRTSAFPCDDRHNEFLDKRMRCRMTIRMENPTAPINEENLPIVHRVHRARGEIDLLDDPHARGLPPICSTTL